MWYTSSSSPSSTDYLAIKDEPSEGTIALSRRNHVARHWCVAVSNLGVSFSGDCTMSPWRGGGMTYE
jgi:hypothetical protein